MSGEICIMTVYVYIWFQEGAMNNLIKYIFVPLTIIACLPINFAWANEEHKNYQYQVGIHSMLVNGSMELSKIDPSFNDLSSDGIGGPHHSSLYLLRTVNEYLRIGVETLVGNSENKNSTTMNFQGAGVLFDISQGDKYFVNGGLHAGGVIVNVMSHSNGTAADNGVNSGIHYKDTGLFVAPYFGVGINFGKHELSLITKWIFMSEGNNDDIDAFNAQYTGIGLGMKF
jgi:hypothetical protein